MKKIFASIFTIFATGALAAGATGAWMNSGGGHGGYDFRRGRIDLKIDHTDSLYNGLECVDGRWVGEGGEYAGDPCREWDAKNLGKKDKFYLFSDVKPGDWGRDIISLHANAKETLHACVFAFNARNKENDINEPEEEAGDATGGRRGELSQFLKVFAWLDLDQDGIFDPGGGEKKLYQGLMKNEAILVEIKKKQPLYIGTAWCAGEQAVNMASGEISCDGEGMGNIAQTDSLRFALIGYAEAKRWYAPLLCRKVRDEYHERYGATSNDKYDSTITVHKIINGLIKSSKKYS